jgi:phosphoglycolate phosphatase
MNKHVVFDFDGTIVDTKTQFFKVYNSIAEKYGLRIVNENEFDHLSSMSLKVSLAERYKMLGVPLYKLPLMLYRAPMIAKEVRGRLKNKVSEFIMFDGMRDVFSGLKALGFNLSIISANAVSNIEEFLKRNDLDFFDGIYPSKGQHGKYYTIKRFLKKMKIEKEDMIYIGDEIRDIFSCKRAGVRVISVSWGLNSTKALKEGKPDYMAHSPSELIKIINEVLGSSDGVPLKPCV